MAPQAPPCALDIDSPAVILDFAAPAPYPYTVPSSARNINLNRSNTMATTYDSIFAAANAAKRLTRNGGRLYVIVTKEATTTRNGYTRTLPCEFGLTDDPTARRNCEGFASCGEYHDGSPY